MPAAPTGRKYSSTHLIRIVDPLGEAIAWFAPDIGACCAGYAIRQVRGASSESVWWREIITASAITHPRRLSSHGKNDDRNVDSAWRFVDRDPTSCILDWKVGKGLQAEHWQMVASLADARLSLSLRIWNTDATPIQTGVRLRLALTAPPDIIARTVRPTSNDEPADYIQDMHSLENQDERIAITVEAAPGTSTTQTDYVGDEITCTIAYHPPDDPASLIRPSECQRLSVQIGL